MCQFPGCYGRSSLQMHHIKRYQDYPTLRFNEDNLILLCKDCHKKVKGNEVKYAPIFTRLVNKNKNAQIYCNKR